MRSAAHTTRELVAAFAVLLALAALAAFALWGMGPVFGADLGRAGEQHAGRARGAGARARGRR